MSRTHCGVMKTAARTHLSLSALFNKLYAGDCNVMSTLADCQADSPLPCPLSVVVFVEMTVGPSDGHHDGSFESCGHVHELTRR
jgi:hypothetical protein